MISLVTVYSTVPNSAHATALSMALSSCFSLLLQEQKSSSAKSRNVVFLVHLQKLGG